MVIQLNTTAAILVVHPKLVDATSFGSDDVVAIAGPYRRGKIISSVFGELEGVFLFCVDVPDVITTTAVGGEQYFFAIGAEARMGFKGEAFGNRAGITALDGQGIDISHQVEGNFFTIGTYVDAHPGTFIGSEADLSFRLKWKSLEAGVLDGIFFRGV